MSDRFEFAQALGNALDPFSSGLVEVAIDRIRELEHSLRTHDVALDEIERLHCIEWCRIQRVALWNEMSDLTCAEELIDDVVEELATVPVRHPMLAQECFCIEQMTAGLLKADVLKSRGYFSQAIRVLDDLYLSFRHATFHGDSSCFGQMTSLRSVCSEYLGHDSDSVVYVGGRNNSNDQSHETHWTIPVPLCGVMYSAYQGEWSERSAEYHFVDEDSAIEKYDALNSLRDFTSTWAEQFPEAMVPRQRLTIYELWRARLEMRLELFEQFESTTEALQEELDSELESSSESVYHYLAVVRSLVALALDVGWHDYPTEEFRSRYVPVSYGCIVTGANLIEILTEECPVDQALALVISKHSNTAAGIYQLFEQFNEAASEDSKCRVIINELLKRDPMNEVALRLRVAYLSIVVVIDPEIEATIQNWNWSIETV